MKYFLPTLELEFATLDAAIAAARSAMISSDEPMFCVPITNSSSVVVVVVTDDANGITVHTLVK